MIRTFAGKEGHRRYRAHNVQPKIHFGEILDLLLTKKSVCLLPQHDVISTSKHTHISRRHAHISHTHTHTHTHTHITHTHTYHAHAHNHTQCGQVLLPFLLFGVMIFRSSAHYPPQELFKPQEIYSSSSTRQIFDRIAHSSVRQTVQPPPPIPAPCVPCFSPLTSF
jgi:hypothetical protein